MKKLTSISLIALTVSIVTTNIINARTVGATAISDTKTMLHAKTQKEKEKASLKVLADISSTPEDKEIARKFFIHNSLKRIIDKKGTELAELKKEYTIISKEVKAIKADMPAAEAKKLDYVTTALYVGTGVAAAYAAYYFGVPSIMLNALKSGAGAASSAAQKIWSYAPSIPYLSSTSTTPPANGGNTTTPAPQPDVASAPGYFETAKNLTGSAAATAKDFALSHAQQYVMAGVLSWSGTKLYKYFTDPSRSDKERVALIKQLEDALKNPTTPANKKAEIETNLNLLKSSIN